ncbi:MAG: serine hydrolase domain-containing protein [Gemmatimonadales bacterium]
MAIACATPLDAQAPPTAASLRRSSFSWNQAEREFGFAHWDEVFPSRPIARGATVRPLPAGLPIAGLAPGTPGGQHLAQYLTEQKVGGLIVLQDGAVRIERYGLGYQSTGRWVSQSVAKAITSTLVGVAVRDGFIAGIDELVTRYLPALAGSGYDGVTIRQVLTMSSGVQWNEDYTDPESDIARFYRAPIAPGLTATVSYLRGLKREAPPGTKWAYKTGETHLIGAVVVAATKRPLAEYLSEKIWAPYGMERAASWMIDRSQQELAGCCLQASLRDFARFGQFVLDGGRIDGRAVVPDGWFAEATRQHWPTSYPERGYGFQWWTGAGKTFDAIGIHGQLIHLDPSRRLVVAINSAWPEATSRERTLARIALLATIAAALDAERR